MPYALKLYAYLFVDYTLFVVILVRWVKPFGGSIACFTFGLAYTYMTIKFGRWLFGWKEL